MWDFTVFIILVVICYLVYRWVKRNRREEKDYRNHVPETFVVVDVETTGLDPGRHEIIEIGAIKINRGSNEHKSLTALVKPSRKIPKKITKITGITQKMVDNDGEELDSVIIDFLDFFEEYRLVAYNAPFDMAFLERAAAYRAVAVSISTIRIRIGAIFAAG